MDITPLIEAGVMNSKITQVLKAIVIAGIIANIALSIADTAKIANFIVNKTCSLA